MTADGDQYGFENSVCTEQMIRLTDQVTLRILCYTPACEAENIPVVLVTGLVTEVKSFVNIIHELSRDFPVYYIETRDKSSSLVHEEVRYDIETMGIDVAEIIQQLGLKSGKFVMVGYSFGAAVIADGFRHFRAIPHSVVFIEPTPVFHYPRWSIKLIKWYGKPLYQIIMPLAKWYLQNIVINKKEDLEMAEISSNSLSHANPDKLRNTVLAIAGYEVWDKLGSISCPALIIGTSKDRLHNRDETSRMVSAIKNSSYIDLENNLRTHSAETAKIIRTFIKNGKLTSDLI